MLTPSSNTILEPMTQRMLQDLSILVTHDQEEAMSMAVHIIVMNKGKIVQQDDAESLYNSSRTRFVGEFLGKMNWFEGEFSEHNDVGCRNFRTDDGLDTISQSRLAAIKFTSNRECASGTYDAVRSGSGVNGRQLFRNGIPC